MKKIITLTAVISLVIFMLFSAGGCNEETTEENVEEAIEKEEDVAEEEVTTYYAYKDLIRDWVNLCRGSGVIPALATVVPIDPNNPSNWAGQLESILEFNDWIRDYCVNENISLLDLEAALRVSVDNRTLNPAYDSGDGLHPNDLAYTEKLDHILIPVLEEALGN